jgi:hypothetical protein
MTASSSSAAHANKLLGKCLLGGGGGTIHASSPTLPDQLHLDAATHRRIGECFAKRAFTANGPFAAA